MEGKQSRYLSFLSNYKNRKKLIEKLYHFNDLNWQLFREIKGNENEWELILNKINTKKFSECNIISTIQELDGKTIPAAELNKGIVENEGLILIFDNAEMVYYQGESPGKRFISI